MRKKYYNLLNDHLFKMIVSEEKYLKILLNDFFKIDFNNVMYLNKEQDIVNKNQKPGTVDILLYLDDMNVILELQKKCDKNFKERLLKYNVYNMYLNGIKKGEDYNDLKKCIIIAIINFNIKSSNILNEVNLIENNKYLFTDKFSILILDLTKFNDKNNILYKLFKFKTKEELETIEKSTNDKNYLEIIEKIKYYNLDEEERLKMNELAKLIAQEPSQREIAYRNGISDGKAIGINEGKIIGINEGKMSEKINIARNLLKQNIDINIIVNVTKLSKNKILELKS